MHEASHGANRVKGSVKKKGENKGILAAKKARKREEAETRNANTLPENRRKNREH